MQMQGIGTSWMLKPPRKPEDDGFDRLIGQMSLTEVRPYMCPKSHGNPKKCEDCDGFRTCQAGQRAVLLMNEAARSEVQEAPAAKPAAEDPVKEREEFRKACESGNAWYYLMQTRGLSKDAAGELLSKLVRKFPGVAADFGGSRRIMQRPKVVKVLESVSEDAQNGQEQASPPDYDEIPSREQERQNAIQEGRKKGESMIREKAMQKAREAFAAGDPIAHIMQTEGIRLEVARQRVYKWMKVYPEIAGGYQMPDLRRKKAEEPKTEKPQEEQQVEFALEDDTVSLADFLNEFDTAEADQREPDADDEMPEKQHLAQRADGRYRCKYKGLEFYGSTEDEALQARDEYKKLEKIQKSEPLEPGCPDALMPEVWNGKEFSDADLTDPLIHMKHRAKWLDQEKARMNEIIRQAEEKIAWIDERLEPLLKVIEKW